MTTLVLDDAELERRLVISGFGGAHAQIKKVVEFVFEQAGNKFAAGDDLGALTLRELGNKLRLWQNEASERLTVAHEQLADYQRAAARRAKEDVDAR